MPDTAFQHPYGAAFVGEMKNLNIVEPGTANAPSSIVTSGEIFAIEVHWEVAGPIAPALNPAYKWNARVFFESIGPGGEGQLGATVVVPYTTHTAGNPALGSPSYHYKATLTGLSLVNPPATPTRAYRLITVITMDDGATPAVPVEIAGYLDGPIVQVVTV